MLPAKFKSALSIFVLALIPRAVYLFASHLPDPAWSPHWNLSTGLLRYATFGYHGERVTNIEPGMVETEFSLVRFEDKTKAEKVYEGMIPLNASDIAETIAWVATRPKHVNIQELVIFPTAQAAVGQVARQAKV